MPAAARSVNEIERLHQLYELDILGTPPDPQMDELAKIAAAFFKTPIALVSLVDDERQWFKAQIGLEAKETPRDVSFCAHAILSAEVLVVRDALADERFADSPLVIGPPFIRFYAGAPLKMPSGEKIGTLCIIDHKPRQNFSPEDAATLRRLGDLVETHISLRFLSQRLIMELQDRQDLIASFERERLSYEKRLDYKHTLLTETLNAVRGPARALTTAVSTAQGDQVDSYPQNTRQDFHRIAVDASTALNEVVARLTRAASVRAASLPLERTSIQLNALIRDCVGAVAPSARLSGLALTVTTPRQLVNIHGDRIKLKQVIHSLLSNSLSFSPAGATIRVSLASPEFGMARVVVADTGVGFTPEELQRVIATFDKTAAMSATGARTTGLGLATAAMIVERHGGLLSIDSAIGKGTTVTVRLPCT